MSEQSATQSRSTLAAMVFALLSSTCAVAAIQTCWAWLLVPYGACAVAAVVLCAIGGWRLARIPAAGAIILLVVGTFVGAWLFTGACCVREAAQCADADDNLCGISAVMHTYYQIHGRFPPVAVSDVNGKPLLSWRVTLLPFVEQTALYQRFKLDEPWDSPHNYALIGEMPSIYAAPHRPDVALGTTVFQVFVGPGTAFDPKAPLRLPPTDFPGGPRELLLIAEAAHAVTWTKPEDLPYAADQRLPALGSVLKYRRNPSPLFVPIPFRAMLARDASGQSHMIDLDAIDEETLRHHIALPPDGE